MQIRLCEHILPILVTELPKQHYECKGFKKIPLKNITNVEKQNEESTTPNPDSKQHQLIALNEVSKLLYKI
jgi:hypothetical protein